MVQKFPPIALGTKRVKVFVDGQNFYHALKKHGIPRVDYEKLARALAAEYGSLVGKLLVTGVYVEEGYVFSRRFTDALRHQGWQVIETPVKRTPWGHEEKESDVVLACEITKDLSNDRWDVVLLLSGDGDLAYPVREATAMGKLVVVVQFQDFISRRLAEAASDVRLLDPEFLDPFVIRKAA